MLLAAMRDNAYNVVLLIHLAAFLIAFAPAVLNPLLAAHFQRSGGAPVLGAWVPFTVRFTQRWALPGLGVLLVTGLLMVVMSDEVIEFSQTWIVLSLVVWLALGGVVSAMILKGEKQLAGGDMAGESLVAKGGQIATVLLVVMLYLMVFKPGF